MEMAKVLIYQGKAKSVYQSDNENEVIIEYRDDATAFNGIKKELVEKGFLDSFSPGGLGQHSIFKISHRWKHYGTSRFEQVPFEPGCGSKQFQVIWKDETKRKILLEARHGKKKPDTVSV